jgi:hypothetical protein
MIAREFSKKWNQWIIYNKVAENFKSIIQRYKEPESEFGRRNLMNGRKKAIDFTDH